MPKRVNPNRIKMHRTYEIVEAAEALEVSTGTVRSWIHSGLPALTSQRPYLIHGSKLREFLNERQEKRKSNLDDTDFYCFKCKAPRPPFGMMADLIWVDANRLQLKALCSTCGTVCTRMIRADRVGEFAAIFDFGVECH